MERIFPLLPNSGDGENGAFQSVLAPKCNIQPRNCTFYPNSSAWERSGIKTPTWSCPSSDLAPIPTVIEGRGDTAHTRQEPARACRGGQHLIHSFGWYSNKARGRRKRALAVVDAISDGEEAGHDTFINKVYEAIFLSYIFAQVDPAVISPIYMLFIDFACILQVGRLFLPARGDKVMDQILKRE